MTLIDRSGQKLQMLRQMILIRRFEQLLDVLFTRGELRGTIHLSEGQEAIAVGMCAAMESDDIVTAGHRANHVVLAKGVPIKELLAEILGLESSFSKGYGGAMHIFAKEYGIWGTSGIIAEALPLAAGIAWANKQQNLPGLVHTFIGDGATTEGAFHEAANMISLWDIPMIIVCENNLYAQTTPLKQHSANTFLSQKVGDMYKIKSVHADGNDANIVFETALEAREYVKRTGKPFFIEFMTYRFSGHSANDKTQSYKKEGEKMAWENKDPIRRLIASLIKQGTITETSEKEIEQEILLEINDALKFAGIK